MNPADLLLLIDYNTWANLRVLNAAQKLTTEQFSEPIGLSHKSVRGALVHVLGAEIVWRLRCQKGISPPGLPSELEYPDLESLRRRWQEEEQRMYIFVNSLTEEDMVRRFTYRSLQGLPKESTLWHALTHVVMHGTQFRAEAGVGLAQFGCSPGDLDLIVFLRERNL